MSIIKLAVGVSLISIFKFTVLMEFYSKRIYYENTRENERTFFVLIQYTVYCILYLVQSRYLINLSDLYLR